MRYSVVVAAMLAIVASAAMGGERALMDRSNRFLDKPYPKAELTPSVVVADSFEDWAKTQKDWKLGEVKAEQSAEHATDGKQSLKVEFANSSAALRYNRGSRGWGSGIPPEEEILGLRALHFDELRMEVFNPGAPAKLLVKATDDTKLEYDLKAGANSLVIPTADLRKEVYRVNDIPQSFAFSLADISEPRTLFFDNMRWIGPGLGRNLIKYAKCLQFGEPVSNKPYFQMVSSTTGYTKERGYGWEKPDTVPPQPWPSIATGTLSGRRCDDLLQWTYLLSTTSPLLVDLPAGKYRLQLVEYGIGFYEVRPCMYDLSVKVNDGKPQVVRKGATTYAEVMKFEYGLDQTDWQPGFDMWKQYRGHLVRPLELDFESKGGTCKLDIASTPRGFENLSFLIIYPVDKADAIEPEIAALWQDLRYRFLEGFAPATVKMAQKMYLPGLHEEFADPDARTKRLTDLKPTDAEKLQGGIVYNRAGVEEVYPDTVPGRNECAAEFKTIAPPGEIGTFTVGLFAVKDLKDVKLEIGDFVGPDNKLIAKSNANVRVVNCMPRMTGHQTHGDWRYMVVPWYLVKRPSVDVANETSRRWWVNVDVPPETPAGTYTAVATLEGKGLTRKEVKLTLEVPSFKLDPMPRDIEESMTFPPPQFGDLADARTVSFIRTYVVYSHMDALEKPEYAKWKVIFDPALKAMEARVPAELAMLKRIGLNCVYMGAIPTDPLWTVPQFAVEGMEIFTYSYASDHAALLNQVAAKKVIYGGGGFLQKQSEEKLQAFAKDKTLPVVFSMNAEPFYWCDVQQEAGLYRFEAGFFLWRLGAKGGIYGPWSEAWRDPYNPTDGHTGEWGAFSTLSSSPDQPNFNSTVILEGLREGVTDYRYVAMLERLIKAKPDAPAAKDAQAFLQKLREQIKPEATYYFHGVGGKAASGWDNAWTQKDTAWKGQDYDSQRGELVKHITALTKG